MQTDVAKTIDQPDMRGPGIKAAHKIDVRSSDARWQRTGRWPAYPQCRPDCGFKAINYLAISPSKGNGRLQIQTRRSEEHTSELQSLMRISYAVFCLKKKNKTNTMNLIHEKLCIHIK